MQATRNSRFTKKLDFEPTRSTQMDFRQCTHDLLYKNGFSRSGNPRKQCAFCGRVWCGKKSKEQVMKEIGECYKNKLSPIDAHNITGCAIVTIHWRYKQFYAIKPINCDCGQPIIHRGKCKFRNVIGLPRHRRVKQKVEIPRTNNWFLNYLNQFHRRSFITREDKLRRYNEC